jgi:hypothetical protein
MKITIYGWSIHHPAAAVEGTGEVGFEQPGAAVLTMQAGKVLRWQMLSDRQEALEVAGLGGDPG